MSAGKIVVRPISGGGETATTTPQVQLPSPYGLPLPEIGPITVIPSEPLPPIDVLTRGVAKYTGVARAMFDWDFARNHVELKFEDVHGAVLAFSLGPEGVDVVASTRLGADTLLLRVPTISPHVIALVPAIAFELLYTVLQYVVQEAMKPYEGGTPIRMDFYHVKPKMFIDYFRRLFGV